MKILLVEDEQKLAQALSRGLTHEGYAVDIVGDGKKALTRISLHRTDYDLIILDLMLPSMDGHEICRQVREWNITIPILILTARAETETKVDLLLSGADDYLVKPFSFAELCARVRALLRRPTEALPETLKVGGIELNPSDRRVVRDGTEIEFDAQGVRTPRILHAAPQPGSEPGRSVKSFMGLQLRRLQQCCRRPCQKSTEKTQY